MKYCKKCLQPDTRPGIVFVDGVCNACRYEESKKNIDWKRREQELKDIADAAIREKEKRGNYYDCIIGVSGGKDSTFQTVYAKEKLGLKPLLINVAPDEITKIGQHNIDNLNRISGGCDIISIKPNPVIAKKLARKTFFERGNIVAASEYCLWGGTYWMAVRLNIPLVIQGENVALTWGTSEKQDCSGNALNVKAGNTVNGFDVEELIAGTDVSKEDVFFYSFPDDSLLQKLDIQAIWLQYYVKEWSFVGNAEFSAARGLLGRMAEDLHDIGRYRRYASLDSDLVIPNQMIKYLKFGFGFATDEVCYDIREGRLSREDAIWLVEEYDGKCGERYIEEACEYLSITKEEFWSTVDRFVNRKLFEKNSDGTWTPKFKVGIDYQE